MGQRKLTLVLSIIYIVLLTWLILFKFQTNIMNMFHYRNINMIPFKNIHLIKFNGLAIVDGKFVFREMFYNILVFVPMGAFISMLKPSWGFFKKVALCFGISLLFEVLQYVFAIGISDVTDLIDNTLGGVIGIGMFFILRRIAGDKAVKIVNILVLACLILFIGLLTLLIIANLNR